MKAREKEEGNEIKNSINDLVNWANQLNLKSKKGKIIVKGYDAMTLDFYWRVDDDMSCPTNGTFMDIPLSYVP